MILTRRGGWPYSHPPNVPFEVNTQSPQVAGLVAWWPFLGNQGAITPLRDRVGAYDLTHYNGPTWNSSAERGWSLAFNGTTQYLLANVAAVETYPISISCWFRVPDVTNYYALVGVGSGAAGEDYINLEAWGQWAGDPVAANCRSEAGPAQEYALSTAGYLANTWTFGCAVFVDNVNRMAYVHGAHRGKNTSGADVCDPANIEKTAIGIRLLSTYSTYLLGQVSDARIYNRALTDAEVWDMYQNRWELYRPVRRLWQIDMPEQPKIGRKKFKRGGWPYSHPPNEPFELNTQSPQAAGLVAWWPFLGNQGATTPLRDRVRGYDLTHYNGPTWIASASRGWALLFDDASSQYLSIASTPVSQLPFSITAWAYCDSAAVEDYAIAALDQSGGFGRHYLGITAAKAAAAYTSDGDTSGEAVSSKVIVVNTWNYVCGVWATASSRAAFLNGGFKGTDSTNLSFTPDRTAIGAWVRGGSYYFSGMISDVRIYNRALSDAEVWDMYQNRWELYRPVRRVWAFTQGVDSMSPFMKKILKPLRRFEFIRRLEL